MNMKQTDFDTYLLPAYKRQTVCFERGDNATLWDSEGKEYIDFAAGVAVCSIGHGNVRLARAISDQAAKIIHVSNLYCIEPQAECARHIVSLSGYDMKCFFGNSGTEANEGAIKIARKYGVRDGKIKRYKIITLENSFHGRTITALKATGQVAKHDYFGPYPDGFVYATNVEEIESLIDEYTVAVMIELVQGEGGVQPLDPQNIQSLALLLKSKDILLIVDEVQTGVYRCGSFLASHTYGITPDVITLAKGLGGGVPIGVVMTRLKNIFSYGDHGSTFGGNYLSTVAANEVLNILEEYNQSGELMDHQNYFETSLKRFAMEYPNIFMERVGIGMMQGLRVIDGDTLSKIVDTARDSGVLVIKSGKNTLRFVPPLTISKNELDEGFRRLKIAMTKLKKSL